jgi:hypothetical protein
MQDMALFIQ